MINMNMFGQMPGGQSTSERAMEAAQAHLQSQKTAAQLTASQDTGMSATAGINPVADPLGAMGQFGAGVNPMIDPTAKNFSPSATEAGAGIYGTNLDKQFSFMNPGINTSALI